MDEPALRMSIIDAWRTTATYVAGHAAEFSGQKKETLVLRRLREEIERVARSVRVTGPDVQERFNSWSIDLVCRDTSDTIAVEGKYKTARDSAVSDNRKWAFFDIYKLENYVESGRYSEGFFLFLVDMPDYARPTSGDSQDFSTHDGRVYEAGAPLNATRWIVPLGPPLTLKRRYVFKWEKVGGTNWRYLSLGISSKIV
jgi:hypothetical protein